MFGVEQCHLFLFTYFKYNICLVTPCLMSTFHFFFFFLGVRRICSALLETLVGGDEGERRLGLLGWLANSKIDLFRLKKRETTQR